MSDPSTPKRQPQEPPAIVPGQAAAPARAQPHDAAEARPAGGPAADRPAADTYRKMVDPEAATFETPDAVGMNVGADRTGPPPGKISPPGGTRADTYREMVDPEAATFDTPDAIGMNVQADRVEPPAGKKPPGS